MRINQNFKEHPSSHNHPHHINKEYSKDCYKRQVCSGKQCKRQAENPAENTMRKILWQSSQDSKHKVLLEYGPMRVIIARTNLKKKKKQLNHDYINTIPTMKVWQNEKHAHTSKKNISFSLLSHTVCMAFNQKLQGIQEKTF